MSNREFATSIRLSQGFYQGTLGSDWNFCILLQQKKINDELSILSVKLPSAGRNVDSLFHRKGAKNAKVRRAFHSVLCETQRSLRLRVKCLF
jgi:hypothetical protein